MMFYKFYKILIYLVVSIYFANPVFGKTKLLGTEKYWKAYSTKLDKTKTCFITEPIEQKEFNKNRVNHCFCND